MHDLIEQLPPYQSPGGMFLSEVYLPTTAGEDANLFITALVVRELTAALAAGEFAGAHELYELRRKALGALLRGEYPVYQHAYAFYPHAAHPFWIGGVLPADADDTCVINLELVRAGKAPSHRLDEVIERYLLVYRAHEAFEQHLTAPWHVPGAFLTWFSSRDEENPLDCCVNANALALMAVAGRTDSPGYRPAVALIEAGLDWAGDHPGRLRSLTPFYPDAAELLAAISHAVASGAEALRDAEACLARRLSGCSDTDPAGRALFSSSTGDVIWKAPVLALARRVRALSLQCGEYT
ncbi:hypothetical protein [Maricaulis sp.]|uniref:hypothetical protein n=1 Tax=Maricaulis sp. TaxID=1486257 RepID=UPI002632ED22|nr:hypothetical protein [Maricaulis sp.]